MKNVCYAAFSAMRKRIMRMRDGGRDPRLDFVIPEHLKTALRAAHLSLLDIGGRSGPLTEFEPFAPFTHLFVCEPDTEEAVCVRENLKTKGGWRDVTVLTEAIHPTQTSVTLNITREPGLSSLLEPDMSVVSQFYASGRGYKHAVKDWDIVSRREVPATTLDHAAQTHKMHHLSVLKIDTQGTELGILQSGLAHVVPSAVAVYVEAEFLPIYKNQPMFGDVHMLLQRQGFRLVDMKRSLLRRMMPGRPPYSKRELAWAHSLYFRDANADESALAARQKYILACVAFLLEFFDYADVLFQDEAVRRFMAEQNIPLLKHEVGDYAAAFWRMLRVRANARQERQYASDAWHDRGNER